MEAWDFSRNVTTSAPITLIMDNDNTAPSVVLTAPSSGRVVPGGLVTLTADASDDRGLAKIVFLLNGSWLGEDTTAPYEVNWDSSTGPDGNVSLEVLAYDLAGNDTRNVVTGGRPVYVDNPGPTVALTSPANGASLFLLTTLQGCSTA